METGNLPSYPCGRWAWLNVQTGALTPFKCGKGNCVSINCRNLFYHRRVSLIQNVVDEYDLRKFFTLTLDRDMVDIEPWEYIHDVWCKFRKRMKRKYKGAFRFISVLEAHKNKNWPHIHGFTNIWMAQKEWSRIWEECGGGPVVWVERVEDGKVTDYVNKQLAVYKYVGKEQLTGAVASTKGERTLWRSQKLRAKKELTKSESCVIVKEDVFNDKGEKIRRIFPHGQKS